MRRVGYVLAAVALLLTTTGSTQASVIFTTDATTFNNLSTNTQTITFTGTAPIDGFAFYGSPPGLTQLGVNFQSANLFAIDEGFSPPSWDWDSGVILQSNFGGDMLVTLPPDVTALGFDFLNFFGTGDYVITVNSASGPAQVFNLNAAARPAHTFGGFVSLDFVPITSVIISNPDALSPTIDNVVFGQTSPEPTSIAAFGLVVLGGLGYARRRKTASA